MTITSQSRLCVAALAALLGSAAWLLADPPDRADNLRVTLVTIVASDKHRDVDPKLKEVAREVQKREAGLTGFRVGRTHKSVPVGVGQKENFKLVDGDDGPSADITVLQKDDSQQRIRLAVKAPQVGEVTYSTCYEKFFPILTRVITKDGQRLILAIMVKQAAKESKDPKPR